MRIFEATYRFDKVYDIMPEWLGSHGKTALILDIDNTLTEHDSQELSPCVSDWLSAMKSAGIKMTVLSNNDAERVAPFAEKIGLAFVSDASKPLKKGILEAVDKLGEGKEHTLLIGDQIFTDIVGGNFAGVDTVLVEPIKEETKGFLKFKRKLEKFFSLR